MDETEGALTASQLEVLALLEYLYDARSTQEPNNLSDYDWAPDDRPRLVNAADGTGLVTTFRSYMTNDETHPPVILNNFGVRHVEEVRQARNDPVKRRRACRNTVLRRVERSGERGRAVSIQSGWGPDDLYFGSEFTRVEIRKASDYLVEQGLLEHGPLRAGQFSTAGVTAEGRRCVEDFDGNVRLFLTQSGPVSSVSYSNTQHFNGTVSGQVAQGQHVQQTQHHSGVSPELVAQLLAPVEHAIQSWEDRDDRGLLELAIGQLRAEVLQDSPDRAEVERKAGLLQRASTLVGATAVTAATTLATNELLAAIGGQI